MGAVSSMCCETEKSSHSEKALPKPVKIKPENRKVDIDDEKKEQKVVPGNPKPNEDRPVPDVIQPKAVEPEK